MEIGKKVKEVTTEPAPIRVEPRPIKMPDTREPVTVPVRRGAPLKQRELEAPAPLTWDDGNYLESGSAILYCPRCGKKLQIKDTTIGGIDNCSKHGFFVTDKSGNLISVKSELLN